MSSGFKVLYLVKVSDRGLEKPLRSGDGPKNRADLTASISLSPALRGLASRGRDAQEEGSVQGKGSLHGRRPLRFPRVQSAPSLRDLLHRGIGSFLLAACDYGLEQGNVHGARYRAHRHLGSGDAASVGLEADGVRSIGPGGQGTL